MASVRAIEENVGEEKEAVIPVPVPSLTFSAEEKRRIKSKEIIRALIQIDRILNEIHVQERGEELEGNLMVTNRLRPLFDQLVTAIKYPDRVVAQVTLTGSYDGGVATAAAAAIDAFEAEYEAQKPSIPEKHCAYRAWVRAQKHIVRAIEGIGLPVAFGEISKAITRPIYRAIHHDALTGSGVERAKLSGVFVGLAVGGLFAVCKTESYLKAKQEAAKTIGDHLDTIKKEIGNYCCVKGCL